MDNQALILLIGIPLGVYLVFLFFSMRDLKTPPPPTINKWPIVPLPDKDKQPTPKPNSTPASPPPSDPPRYALDYSGRLWVEKKRKGFFRPLRQPKLPPDKPS